MKEKKFIYITISIIVLVVLAGLVYLYVVKENVPQNNIVQPLSSVEFATLNTNKPSPPLGLREYKNTQYKFSFFIPEKFNLEEFNEGKDAQTIVFQDIENVLGFQIFVVPYKNSRVSQERFLKDVPSGVRKNQNEFYIDGVLATAFYSTNSFLGETFEVWFIKDNFLYEITTLREKDAW